MSGIARADVTKLKISFFFDPNEMTYQTTLKPWIDMVNAEGKGIVELEPYFSGTLGKGPGVQVQTVAIGRAALENAQACDAACSHLVFNEEVLAPSLAELFRKRSGSNVWRTQAAEDDKAIGIRR